MSIKLEMSVGDCRFSAEGDIVEVRSLAESFWPLMIASADQSPTDAPPEQTKLNERVVLKRRTKPSVRAKPNSSTANSEDGYSPDELANIIKAHDQFLAINAKILMVSGKWIDKCKLVAFIADGKITSGYVRRTLEALKIKSDLPTISRTLSGNSTDFLTDGSNPVRYELTARAKVGFIAWLGE